MERRKKEAEERKKEVERSKQRNKQDDLSGVWGVRASTRYLLNS